VVEQQPRENAMLLRSEDNAQFSGQIEKAADKIWASYSIEGRVNDKPMTQSDKRMFASEVEARTWLIGEAEERGFHGFEPQVRPSA
jgi:hypothetical protein